MLSCSPTHLPHSLPPPALRNHRVAQADTRTVAPVLAMEDTAELDVARRCALCYRGSRGNANLFTVILDGLPEDAPAIRDAMTLDGISVDDFGLKVS